MEWFYDGIQDKASELEKYSVRSSEDGNKFTYRYDFFKRKRTIWKNYGWNLCKKIYLNQGNWWVSRDDLIIRMIKIVFINFYYGVF